MDIQSQIIDILADQLGIEKKKITPESKFAEDLGADSLDTVEINQVIEEKFNISIPNEDAAKIKKVQDVIDYIKSRLNG